MNFELTYTRDAPLHRNETSVTIEFVDLGTEDVSSTS